MAGQSFTVLQTIQQAMVEMGLPKPLTAVSNPEVTVQQMVALLNRAGNEMVMGYPFQQLRKTWVVTTVAGQDKYDLPADWNYFLDQTQWDRTNHWPLLGPKTPQEWEWLKGGLLSAGPRLRYRVDADKFQIHPVPAAPGSGTFVPWTLAMEYIILNWLMDSNTSTTLYSYPTHDSDILLLDPWVIVAFLKLKFYEAKGLDTTAFKQDFSVVWESRIGKNKGAPILTLAPRPTTNLIGINNIPDGSWNVGGSP